LAHESALLPVAGTTGREIELKLHTDPQDMARLARHPAFQAMAEGAERVQRQTTTYYDTPDLRLAARGVALRVRQGDDGRTSQMVKTLNSVAAGDTAAVAVRREWEWPLVGDTPDFALLRGDGVTHLVPADALPALTAIFATEIRRTTVLVRPDAHTTVEIAFDLGVVRAGARIHPVSEIELELRNGKVGALFDLALALQTIVPLRIAGESKAEAGYRMVTGRPPVPDQSEPAALSPATTVAEAFRHVVRHCLRQLLHNEDCALAALAEPGGGDGRAVRFIRHALRRLRYGLELFEPVIASAEATTFAAQCRRLARRLEPARDWSMVGPLLRLAGAGSAAAGVAPGTDSAAAREAAVTAREAILAPEFTTLVLACGGWLEQERWCERAGADVRRQLARPVAEEVGPWLDRVYRRVRKAGSERGEPDDLKRLRRRLRRLHDAADGFRGLFPPAMTRPFLATLVDLRALVDEIQDLRCIGGLLRDAGVRLGADDQAGLELRGRNSLTQLPETWRRFKEAEPFWKRPG
jgi:inorganic triphosphatase YgiF